MAILTLGISHRRAPIELLERLAFSDDDVVKASAHVRDLDGLDGVVVLSTCNRVELHGSVRSYHAGFLALKRLLLETSGVAADELADPLYAHWERDAADHLFAVAAGIDSMVLGETQIYAQVRDALRRSEAEGTVDRSLTGLFHSAARTGRRVRQETALGAAPDAFVTLAAGLADDALGGLENREAVVVGAGQMAGLAAKHLRRRGVGAMTVLNRSPERAEALASRVDAASGDLSALPEALARADVVVSATGASSVVVPAEAVERALRSRPDRPVALVDLAVPRDVDPAVAGIDGARLFDVAALRDHLTGDDGAARDIAAAHEIVAEEVRRWVIRRRGDRLAPLITAIRRRGDEIVATELSRYAKRLTDLTPDEHEAVEGLARSIAAKLLHDPIVGLKERSEPWASGAHARLLAELLGIDPDAPEGERGTPDPPAR